MTGSAWWKLTAGRMSQEEWDAYGAMIHANIYGCADPASLTDEAEDAARHTITAGRTHRTP